jgi:hypothetical protein
VHQISRVFSGWGSLTSATISECRTSIFHITDTTASAPNGALSGGARARRPTSTLGWAALRDSYSISWSVRSNTDWGILSPRALAVLRLITSSNLVGCWTGRSAGLAPLRMRSTYEAAFSN